MSFWMRFTLAVLATWRVTHLLASEDGPADIIVRFRSLLGQSLAGQLMDCFNCFSIWVAAAAALFVSRRPLEWMFVWLALSGGACLLEGFTSHTLTQAGPTAMEGDMSTVLRPEADEDHEHCDSENNILCAKQSRQC